MYALIDCNSFYASCEKVFRPDLADRPVVVLSNNDGCVIAATKDAKAHGLVIGVPYFQAKPVCRRINAAVFSSNYTLYGDLSRRVMRTLATFSKRMEIYSIDEAFLDLEEMPRAKAERFGDIIVSTIAKWIGLPVTAGLAGTKTIAKIANRRAKSLGLRSLKLESDDDIDATLADLPVVGVWGVSTRWGRRLNSLGIFTALDLKKMPPPQARKAFGIVMERTVRELNGEKCIELELQPPAKKQIHVSRSFGKLVTDLGELEQAVASYAFRVGEKLRRQDSFANALYVWVATNPFRDQDKQYSNAVSIPLIPATSSASDLLAAAGHGIRHIYREGYHFKKAGVMALDLVSASAELASGNLFFDRKAREKQMALMATLDKTNRRYGAGTLVYASQGLGDEDWRMLRKMTSPLYTTRWSDIPEITT